MLSSRHATRFQVDWTLKAIYAKDMNSPVFYFSEFPHEENQFCQISFHTITLWASDIQQYEFITKDQLQDWLDALV